MTHFSQICHGLKKMHDMKVAHRQLDSKVVLMTGHGMKVSGVGEACSLQKTVISDESYYDKYSEEDGCRISRKADGVIFQV